MKKILSACALATAFLALPASAQWYAGVGAGSSRATGADGTFSGTTITGGNSSKSSYKIYGGYQFTPTWGTELQYTDLGTRNFQLTNPGITGTGTGNFRASQYSIAGTGTLPLGNSAFSLLGKLGISANRSNGSVTAPFIVSNQNKSDLLVGVGVQYKITPQLSARLEYEDFGKFSSNSATNGVIRVNNYSLNLQYAF